MKKALKFASGIGLVLIGLVGLLLPIMPGWVFIIPGLVILADFFPPIRRLVDWAKAKLEAADVPGFQGSRNSEQQTVSAKMKDRPE